MASNSGIFHLLSFLDFSRWDLREIFASGSGFLGKTGIFVPGGEGRAGICSVQVHPELPWEMLLDENLWNSVTCKEMRAGGKTGKVAHGTPQTRK